MPGVAELPLHSGSVPAWMLRLMERMSKSILEALVELKGQDSIVLGLSDPFWFQAFNNVIGMDWDSSGSTTVLLGVLKSVTWSNPDLGVLVLGGKGSRMLQVPDEAREASRLLGVDGEYLVKFSRLAARLDSSLLQDGYTLYHHSIVVSRSGLAVVVQQGMNVDVGLARRYHVDKFAVEEPHSGVAGEPGEALNATASESGVARRAYLDIVYEGPERILRMLAEVNRIVKGATTLDSTWRNVGGLKRLLGIKPYYYPVEPTPQLLKAVEELSKYQPTSDIELALAPGLGPKTVRALALIADLIYNAPTSVRDPVTHPLNPYLYAYAVGGKDGKPYPYDRSTVEKTILTLEEALDKARIGDKERLKALLRLRKLLPKG